MSVIDDHCHNSVYDDNHHDIDVEQLGEEISGEVHEAACDDQDGDDCCLYLLIADYIYQDDDDDDYID